MARRSTTRRSIERIMRWIARGVNRRGDAARARTTRAWRLAAVAALAVLDAAPALAQEPTALRVVAFAGGSNWPIWVAQEQGLFARNGVAVTLAFTPSSVQLVKDMLAGTYDVAMTAADNIVAYDEGQGEAGPSEAPDLIAFMGADDGLLSVMAAPDITGLAALKGKTLSVDAMTTGFAFVLREMLARSGVAEAAVSFVRVGGGLQRLNALRDGAQAATLLNTPLDILAEESGFRRLAGVSETLGAYQGIVAAARRGWLDAHGAAAVGFLRGYKAAMDWLGDPGNRQAALDILTTKLAGTSPAVADRTYDALLGAPGGLYRDLAIDLDGMRTVLALRSKYGEPRKMLGDPMKYVDLSYRERALAPR
jgi:ABC-type nitrate/sulfonate/bicarbonate transport system substrate-binding protein